eukprot:TRINITY_DN9471_c0_g1_i2.p1 TRINITY_DN9471_c0_g1~~TRINITY_DN9471_c0_g1_i2.p1  ORF type:complete len:340 (+),score=67.16 TRINITY_DN9471_c0_g1_i2:376-1395(+)
MMMSQMVTSSSCTRMFVNLSSSTWMSLICLHWHAQTKRCGLYLKTTKYVTLLFLQHRQIWLPICQEWLDPQFLQQLPQDLPPRYFKQLFGAKRPAMNVMLIIRDRTKTDENWLPISNPHAWRSTIRRELLQYEHFVLPERFGIMRDVDGQRLGEIMFLDKDEGMKLIERRDRLSDFQRVDREDLECPWAGEISGFMRINANGKIPQFLDSTKGGVIFFNSRRSVSGFEYSKLYATHIFRDFAKTSEPPWIVMPSRVKKRNPYLTDAVESINAEFKDFFEPLPGNRRVKIDPTPITLDGKVYPMVLDPRLTNVPKPGNYLIRRSVMLWLLAKNSWEIVNG